MDELNTLINKALDKMESVRETLQAMISICESTEGSEQILEQIEGASSKFVVANEALNDIFSAVEDKME